MTKYIALLFMLCGLSYGQVPTECQNLPDGNNAAQPLGTFINPNPITALNTTDTNNVQHANACIGQGTPSLLQGNIIFSRPVGFGGPPSQNSPFLPLEVNARVDNDRVGLVITNSSPITKAMSAFIMRQCVAGCGPFFRLDSDTNFNGTSDMVGLGGSGVANLYWTISNCTLCVPKYGTGGTPTLSFQISGGSTDARTNPGFAITQGHLAHGTTGVNNDNWGTATCAASTATVTFTTSFTNATYKVLLTDQTTAGGARVSTKNVGSFIITCTGATDSVDYLVLGNPY